MRRRNIVTFTIVLCTIMLLHACDLSDAFPPPEKPLQTRILRIEILPNDTLAPGDTATFRCIIVDSLNARFEFSWSLDDIDERKYVITDTNSIEWIAPSASRSYGHRIVVDNNSNDSTTVSEQFNIQFQD